jgi:general secretion pathway protein D
VTRTSIIVAVLGAGGVVWAQGTQVEPPPPSRVRLHGPPGSAPTSPTPAPSPAAPLPPPPLPAPAPPAPTGVTPPPGTPPAAGTEPTLPGEKEALKPCAKLPAGKKFKLTLRGEVDTNQLIAWMSATFCRPFVVPGTLRQAKVTILAEDAMTPQEMYRVALSSLEAMGLTIQPEGKVLKVIESNRARESAIPIYDGEPPAQDQFVTRLLRLEHVSTDDVKGVLDRLRGRDGDITPYPPTNTLVITDLANNIRRMEEVVRQLDVPMGGEKIWLIKLHTVSATDMANMLQTIFGVGKAGQPGAPRRLAAPQPTSGQPGNAPAAGGAILGADLSVSQIIPDDRTNSLIIVSTMWPGRWRAWVPRSAAPRRAEPPAGPQLLLRLRRRAPRINPVRLDSSRARCASPPTSRPTHWWCWRLAAITSRFAISSRSWTSRGGRCSSRRPSLRSRSTRRAR